VQAVVGTVERTLNRQKQPVRLIVTGGDAKVLLPHLAGYSPEDRPLLVLEGLAKLAAIA
jgi:pantothenate kinase type III